MSPNRNFLDQIIEKHWEFSRVVDTLSWRGGASSEKEAPFNQEEEFPEETFVGTAWGAYFK